MYRLRIPSVAEIFRICIAGGNGLSLIFFCVCVCSKVMMLCSSSSLLVEPKQPADTVPMSDMRQLFNWATRSQSTTTAAAAAATMIQ